jgi:RNA polymerase sigma-70 factor (ECF subfamily)
VEITGLETPASLLERLRNPADAGAWARFVELYAPTLYDWARKSGMQDADAADLVQDVLTSLFKKMPEFTYDRSQRFRSWLRTVLLNKWREVRRRRSLRTSPLDTATADAAAPDELADLEEREYRRQVVHRALQVLRPEFSTGDWSAFWGYVMTGRPAVQVAAELGVRIGTVYAAKSRVLSRLRRELDGLLDMG